MLIDGAFVLAAVWTIGAAWKLKQMWRTHLRSRAYLRRMGLGDWQTYLPAQWVIGPALWFVPFFLSFTDWLEED